MFVYAYRKYQKKKRAREAEQPSVNTAAASRTPHPVTADDALKPASTAKHDTSASSAPHALSADSEQGVTPVVHNDKSQPLHTHEDILTQDSSHGQTATAAPTNAVVDARAEERKARRRQAKSAARKYRWRLIGGLFLPYFIASTDITIVATALPFIASHFDHINQLNWIVTAFTITSTSFIPVWGQLADLFGRHAVLQAVMVIMMVGAALAAGARDWVMLLFGRALMGVSAAGILNIIKIVLADRVTLEQNARNNSIFAIVGGVSYGVGPVIGGYLTNTSWRWCFILNIPVAALAMVTIFLLLRHDLVGPAPFPDDDDDNNNNKYAASGTWRRRLHKFRRQLLTVDFGGFVLFVGGVTLIILGTTWGGSTYPWRSAGVIAPLTIGGCMLVGFFVYEFLLEPGRLVQRLLVRLFSHNSSVQQQQQPMIPITLFTTRRLRDIPLLAWLGFSQGAALYSIFYFVGIYFTIVKGYEASRAGIQLLYYLPGIGVGVYLAMFACNIWPRQTWPPLFLGSVLETTGFAVLAWALHTGCVSVIAGMMGLAGAGTGMRMMPLSLHVAGRTMSETNALIGDRANPTADTHQHVAGHGAASPLLARAMPLVDFAVPFGGTIAIAMMGSVFNNKLINNLSSNGFTGGASGADNVESLRYDQNSLSTINDLPSAQLGLFRDAARQAVVIAYVAVIPIIALAILACLVLGNVRISMPKSDDSQAGEEVEKGATGEEGAGGAAEAEAEAGEKL